MIITVYTLTGKMTPKQQNFKINKQVENICTKFGKVPIIPPPPHRKKILKNIHQVVAVIISLGDGTD